MCVWACVLSSFTWYGGRDMNTALKHNITAFLWQMSSAAVLAGPQVHAQNSQTHKRKRKVFHCIYIRIEKATTFPGCCRPFRGHSPQGQVIRNLTLYSDEIGAIL